MRSQQPHHSQTPDTALDTAARPGAQPLPTLSHTEFLVLRELRNGEVASSYLQKILEVGGTDEARPMRLQMLLGELEKRGLIERAEPNAGHSEASVFPDPHFRATRDGFEAFHRSIEFYRAAGVAITVTPALSGKKICELAVLNRSRSVLEERLAKAGEPMALRPVEDAIHEFEKRSFKRWNGLGSAAVGDILGAIVLVGALKQHDAEGLIDNSDFSPSVKEAAKLAMQRKLTAAAADKTS